ncbi:MAG: hypothetical protein OEV44_14240, partial [Spirochaetota bacterium]|nr:hypothetical protein [Spirochaetota bacterium]
MNYYKFRILLSFYFILLLSISCVEEKPPAKSLHLNELPTIITNIKKNNEKIPSFNCKFGISLTSKEKRITADGEAYIDKKRKRIKIILIDTLTNETLLDLIVVNKEISLFLYNTDGGVLINGNLHKLSLDKYISDFKIELIDLIQIVSGNSFIFERINKIVQQEDSDYFYFLLEEQDKVEKLSISKSDKQIKKLIVYNAGKEAFRIHYKKYFNFNK